MVDIDELKKRLYQSGEKFSDRPKQTSWQPGRPMDPVKENGVSEYWQRPVAQTPNPLKSRYIKIALISLGTLVVVGGIFWFFWSKNFDKSEVMLTLESPDRVVAGENINFLVKYQNNTNNALDNVKVVFIYPDNSLPEVGTDLVVKKTIGVVESKQSGEIIFKGKILGQKDSTKESRVTINYQPRGIQSFFENNASAQSMIIAVPVIMNFDLPEKLVSDQELNITLRYNNTSAVSFFGLFLKIDYPAGFKFGSAYPDPFQENNQWEIFELGAREEGKILISGTITGQSNDSEVFNAQIGFKNDDNFTTLAEVLGSGLISDSPLSITQSVEGAESNLVNPKDRLYYKITYQNTASVPIISANITVEIQSSALDLKSIDSDTGNFDSNTNKLFWNTSNKKDLAVLQPGQTGEVEFNVSVKDKMPVNNFSDKNFAIKTIAKIDSPNVPLSLIGTQINGESELEIKVRTEAVLSVRGYFNDSIISNSGPLPTKVGQTTTFTLYWSILNTSNNLTDVEVSADLPSYVRWQNKISPADVNLKYDSSTGKLTWKISRVVAGTGDIAPAKTVIFQVAFTPSINQVDRSPELIGRSTLVAIDSFTNEKVTAITEALRLENLFDIVNSDQKVVGN
ncbi:MAG: hypothetical protein COU81_03780 [Candidatus Portnoybacteria bacterium CG10_big_fil_rev_8_21_14_0_10_36_7]|uniref:DUF11 domain-containing protein n=1 Tax=Candidatus Portnoybacteria bacterium CG10_big_fil_rev_8_21_14_0_10_36_7 TaxID=1974812 RepID=A0A2M8KDA0_9BACT|nr:MAG: hypothetical protein COU81_03780 [Candidatus Portnoybacteria bacterium CG10_big_fil_rev_8_21_14_0_10_36_7]